MSYKARRYLTKKQ